jgi:hypothetical protein
MLPWNTIDWPWCSQDWTQIIEQPHGKSWMVNHNPIPSLCVAHLCHTADSPVPKNKQSILKSWHSIQIYIPIWQYFNWHGSSWLCCYSQQGHALAGPTSQNLPVFYEIGSGGIPGGPLVYVAGTFLNGLVWLKFFFYVAVVHAIFLLLYFPKERGCLGRSF